MKRQLLVVVGLGVLTLGLIGFQSRAQNSAPEGVMPGASEDYIDAYVQRWREELREGKSGIINDVMKLAEGEDDIFWELYQQYEEEYFALGERRLQTARQLVEAIRAGTLDDATAARLATEALDQRDEINGLLRRYHTLLSEQISPVRAAQFLQIESRVQTIIDLLVAAEIPLIRMENPAPAAGDTSAPATP